jgi:hypothetical protein
MKTHLQANRQDHEDIYLVNSMLIYPVLNWTKSGNTIFRYDIFFACGGTITKVKNLTESKLFNYVCELVGREKNES